jgi:hypothetical protein
MYFAAPPPKSKDAADLVLRASITLTAAGFNPWHGTRKALIRLSPRFYALLCATALPNYAVLRSRRRRYAAPRPGVSGVLCLGGPPAARRAIRRAGQIDQDDSRHAGGYRDAMDSPGLLRWALSSATELASGAPEPVRQAATALLSCGAGEGAQ